jgi:hypothetical protein
MLYAGTTFLVLSPAMPTLYTIQILREAPTLNPPLLPPRQEEHPLLLPRSFFPNGAYWHLCAL